MIQTASAAAMAASSGMGVPFVPVWQLDEDLRFPLYRKWSKATKKNPLQFQRDMLPEHDVNWHNREIRRSKAFKKRGGQ